MSENSINQTTQTLESASPETDYEIELVNLKTQLETLLAGREVEELSSEERARVLDLMTRIEESQTRISLEKQEKEKYWTREQFIEWAKDEVRADNPEQWIDDLFDLSNLAEPRFKSHYVDLTEDTDIENLPPGLIGKEFCCQNAKINEISNGICLERLYLQDCKIEIIPDDISCIVLDLADNPIREINTKASVQRLFLDNTPIKKIPRHSNFELLSLQGCHIEEVDEDIKIGMLFVTFAILNDEVKSALTRLKTEGKIKKLYEE